MRFTVFGSTGFIGSHLAKYIKNSGFECFTPSRTDFKFSKHLGHVFYCIGLTSNFGSHPFETVQSHVCHLSHILQNAQFDSFLYLSSIIVYKNSKTANENDYLTFNPLNNNELYSISKLMGESLCLSTAHSEVRIARLSSVIGFNTRLRSLIDSLIIEAIQKK